MMLSNQRIVLDYYRFITHEVNRRFESAAFRSLI